MNSNNVFTKNLKDLVCCINKVENLPLFMARCNPKSSPQLDYDWIITRRDTKLRFKKLATKNRMRMTEYLLFLVDQEEKKNTGKEKK